MKHVQKGCWQPEVVQFHFASWRSCKSALPSRRVEADKLQGWGLGSIPKLGELPGFSTLKMGVETHCHGELCWVGDLLDPPWIFISMKWVSPKTADDDCDIFVPFGYMPLPRICLNFWCFFWWFEMEDPSKQLVVSSFFSWSRWDDKLAEFELSEVSPLPQFFQWILTNLGFDPCLHHQKTPEFPRNFSGGFSPVDTCEVTQGVPSVCTSRLSRPTRQATIG